MRPMSYLLPFALVLLTTGQLLAQPQDANQATPEQIQFFEKKIRPVLVQNCIQCHSQTQGKIKGKLALDSREGLRRGGESGPAIVPGKPEASLLIRAIEHSDESLKMPPSKKLSEDIVADFKHWIRTGAADPRDMDSRVAGSGVQIDKARSFWAFQPPRAFPAPSVKDTAWPRSDIDRFLLAQLEAKGLRPVPDADRYALLRRLSFDLIGLPPTPAEIQDFLRDSSPDALARVVDRLLENPGFGERWGRHWLDVARYAESSGKQVNINYPHAWRYRDYVIASFNADKPYDQFLREQIAGDLLPARDESQRAEHLIATGFLAIGPKPHNEFNPLQFEMDVVDEQIDTLSQAMLGLTVACARCHDHKFDPISMKDYYALAGIFRSTVTQYGTARGLQNLHPASLISLPPKSGVPAGRPPLSRAERAGLERQIEALTRQRREASRGNEGAQLRLLFIDSRINTLQARLDSYDSDGTPKLLAMGVRDRSFVKDSPLYQRGEVDKPGERVPRGFVQVLGGKPPRIAEGSGRLELAQWLTSPDNPLPARVLVNRVWLHLFGRGLVNTPDNFGMSGELPSHPELLDTLAVSFRENGWSIKKLIRQIVLSRAYQLSTRYDARNYEVDPDNTLVWRMSPRRLEAEPLRDAMLHISGELQSKPPVGSPVAIAGDGPSQLLLRFGADPSRQNVRSVYLPVIRDQTPESLSLFDFADSSLVVGERSTTIVPAQSLYLLNNPFVLRVSASAAARLQKMAGSDEERIRTAYLLFYGRPAKSKEVQSAQKFLNDYAGQVDTVRRPRFGLLRQQGQQEAWSALCQAFFGSAEFLYRN